ncbi:hypothetical protein [Natrinema caseinilyticum]|uniref:hypothetical protein n=1 Tax=Natrinema caseinilyticum TaxID=2961570 RepID=UPI0020C4B322|nr:hypothetical protein [Natrinema caseinilyticum]
MSSERRFEYEKGPRLEDERETDESDSEAVGDDGSDDGPHRERHQLVVRPWKAGAVAGVGAFTVVFAVLYQLAGAMVAGGAFGGSQDRPSRWVMTGLITLGNHGVTIEHGGETIRGGFGYVRGLTSHVGALVPIAVLLAAGYLLVRYVRLETRREAGLAIGSLIGSYIILVTGLSTIARWTPPQALETTEEVQTVAAGTDLGTIVSVGTTAIVFVTIGAAVAALPQLVAARQ